MFRLKLKEFIKDVKKSNIFGPTIAFIHVIEFEKRGHPHAHIIITLAQEDKIVGVDSIDQVICAELPNSNTHPRLYQIVTKFMMHGPCGQLNPNCMCMQNEERKCSKSYPKEFLAHTIDNVDGYPRYRRRQGDHIDSRQFQKLCQGVNGQYLHTFDNRDVVPYNPYLLLKFNAHINVEFCGNIRCVKYLY